MRLGCAGSEVNRAVLFEDRPYLPRGPSRCLARAAAAGGGTSKDGGDAAPEAGEAECEAAPGNPPEAIGSDGGGVGGGVDDIGEAGAPCLRAPRAAPAALEGEMFKKAASSSDSSPPLSRMHDCKYSSSLSLRSFFTESPAKRWVMELRRARGKSLGNSARESCDFSASCNLRKLEKRC